MGLPLILSSVQIRGKPPNQAKQEKGNQNIHQCEHQHWPVAIEVSHCLTRLPGMCIEKDLLQKKIILINPTRSTSQWPQLDWTSDCLASLSSYVAGNHPGTSTIDEPSVVGDGHTECPLLISTLPRQGQVSRQPLPTSLPLPPPPRNSITTIPTPLPALDGFEYQFPPRTRNYISTPTPTPTLARPPGRHPYRYLEPRASCRLRNWSRLPEP